MKLVGSWKLESGVDKGDVREREREKKKKKKRRLKKQRKKKTIVKHKRGIVMILTFEFEHISRLLF